MKGDGGLVDKFRLRRQGRHESREGALSLREKRSGTKRKSRWAAFLLSAGVFQGPSRDSCLPCRFEDNGRIED
ncbi:MAG: hypothetical protein NC407_12630 [Lachnoclostridium sp.]|nr:hypothetical protein [Lachnoclostridium sp.]